MQRRKFIIPMNFMETGYLMNGAIPIRNVAEACVLGLFGYFICRMLPLPTGEEALTPYILIIAPFVMVGVSGIQGDPVSVFIFDFIKWSKRRQPFFYSNHSKAYSQEAADLLMEAPQMRDMLADVLDGVRKKFARKNIDYVEGKTFEFAEDPEQEALREAQDELHAKHEEETVQMLEELKKQEAESQSDYEEPKETAPEGSSSIDAQQVAQMIVLDELNFAEGED